jgi:hypothetical protein
MTIFLTILAGVVTYVLGQLVMKLVIEPVHEFKKVVSDISHSLIEYANVYSNPGVSGEEIEKDVSSILRKLSSRLNAQMYLIPKYKQTARVFGLPSRENTTQAAKHLIGLSNSVFKSAANLATKNAKKADKICTL